MNIGINLLYLLPGIVGGTQTYAEELLRALAVIDTNNQYILFLNEESRDLPLPDASNFRRIVCPVHALSRAARYRYEQMVLPRRVASEGCEILHSLGYVGPLFVRGSCRHLVNIYDLNYMAFKEAMPLLKRLLLGFFVEQTARRADQIIATSAFSRDQIIEHLSISPQKITVVHGADKPRAIGSEYPQAIMATYSLSGPYLIAFSSLSLNKNIPRLIEAFHKIASEIPHSLVLLGHIPPEADLRHQVSRLGISERVVFTGYAPDAHVLTLLSNAELFVFPSWYEGFGIPAIEAQRLGLPVACSNAASLPEVAGEGAAYFDPYDVAGMALTLQRCLRDNELRAQLCERGRRNAERFSWQKAAHETMAVYESLNSNNTTRAF